MARIDAGRAVRRFCLECQGESAAAVRRCADIGCALWPWRLPPEQPAPEPPSPTEKASRRVALLRAVRRQCMACAGHRKEVRLCGAGACPLRPLRFGVTPATYQAVRARFFAPRKLTLF